MVLVWTGRGIVIPLVFLAMAVVALVLTVTVFADPLALTANQATNLIAALACLFSALATWPIGRLLMKQPRVRMIPDPATGRATPVATPDTFLWVDARYWTYILAVVGVVMLAATLVFR